MANPSKTDLIDQVAAATELSKTDTESVINTFLETIQSAVAKGDRVTLTGFGTFEKRHRKARAGVNPGTGEKIRIEATDYPAFKAGATFKDTVK